MHEAPKTVSDVLDKLQKDWNGLFSLRREDKISVIDFAEQTKMLREGAEKMIRRIIKEESK
jgi:hypothetical protein